jgi:hypothetical protein
MNDYDNTEFRHTAWCGGCKKFRLCKKFNKGYLCKNCFLSGQSSMNNFVDSPPKASCEKDDVKE